MTNKIENLTQLKLEIIRLQSIKAQQEIFVKKSFEEVNESLKPVNLVKSISSSFFADKEDNQNLFMYGINKGINYGINFIAEKIFLKDKPEIVKIIGHFLINNVASKIVSFQSGSSFINRIKDVVNVFKHKMASNGSVRHEETYNNPNT